MLATLKEVFGFQEFRPNQEAIVSRILAKRDVFAVMPTGGGKSLCYQLPATMLPGTTIVISPLISLMKDQVDGARENGISAAYLNSSLTPDEKTRVYRAFREDRLDLLYIAPERFAIPGFLDTLKGIPISLFAVDEAHCISEWGHDFRPDYLSLSGMTRTFTDVPVAAFTATATMKVQEDIINRLELRSPYKVRASFNRPNLIYQIHRKEKVEHQIIRYLEERPRDPGIIYRTTRESVVNLAETLVDQGFPALPYHAGMEADERERNQEAFNRDEATIIVATIAFGMGIDKSNVRFVIHADLPKNIESYYQETGRAGRDGEPADCLLFFGRGDIPKIRYFIDKVEDDTERAVALEKLNQMVGYASHHVCRRRQLLGYFQESYPEDNCGTCDVCLHEHGNGRPHNRRSNSDVRHGSNRPTVRHPSHHRGRDRSRHQTNTPDGTRQDQDLRRGQPQRPETLASPGGRAARAGADSAGGLQVSRNQAHRTGAAGAHRKTGRARHQERRKTAAGRTCPSPETLHGNRNL